MGRPYNTPVDDYISTSPERDRLFCELLSVMEECSKEQNFGCDKCPVQERCAHWLDKHTDIGTGFFTPDKLFKRQAEFSVIRAGKNGHNGNGYNGNGGKL